MIKKRIKSALIFAVMIIFTAFFSGCSINNNKGSYSISGYVFDELGNPVSNVEISSEMGTTKTDVSGKYIIKDIENTIIVKPKIDGYFFEESSKSISSEKDDANFVASEKYNISGMVVSGNKPMSKVDVKLKSLSGEIITQTDINGKYCVDDVAGETTVNCLINNKVVSHFVASIKNSKVPTVNLETTLTLKFNFNQEENDIFSKISVFVDGTEIYLDSNILIFDRINCGSIIEIKSNEYAFDKERIVVNDFNKIQEISVNKKYSVSGKVLSGDNPISGAKVYLKNNSNIFTYTNNEGLFQIDNLSNDEILKVSYKNLKFEEKSISLNSNNINFQGTKEINFQFSFDKVLGIDIKVNNQDASFDENYVLKIDNAKLGDEFSFSSSIYHLSENKIIVDESNIYQVNSYIYYNANILVSGLSDYKILLDGKEVDSLNKIFGKHSLSLSYLDYKFDTVEIDANNINANINYLIPFDVSLIVHSGEIVLSNAIVNISGNKIIVNQNGQVDLNNIYGEQKIIVEAIGYNSGEFIVNAETKNLDVELTYNIMGRVLTGKVPVENAKVSVSNKIVNSSSNGEFVIYDLVGKNNIVCEKDYFNFNTFSVEKEDEINFSGNYKIFGTLSDKVGPIENANVYLKNFDNNEKSKIAKTDKNGYYEIDNLNGNYVLYTYDESFSQILQPESYKISFGGRFDFSLVGFKVSGVIKSGDIPISSARVVAGDNVTYSNFNGEFSFELITKPCDLTVYKNGYDFGEKISLSKEILNLEINATYQVIGTIKSGNEIISNATIKSGDKTTTSDSDGKFVLSGLVGENNLTFEKEGFVFDKTYQVKGFVDLQVISKLKKNISVLTGEVEVFDVDCLVNGELLLNSHESSFEILAILGDVITIRKNGYIFNEIEVEKGISNYVFNGNYSIVGHVATGNISLPNSQLSINGENVVVDNLGNFTVSNLTGENNLLATCATFNSQTLIINKYESNLIVNMTYKISGNIKCGSINLQGVNVAWQDNVVQTDSLGYFEIDNVYGNYSLILSKEGYTFDAVENKFNGDKLDIVAYYSISGFVKTGNVAISDAKIELFNNGSLVKTIFSGFDGSFVLDGLSGVNKIVVSKSGYETKTMENISDKKLDILFNLSYSITFNFEVENVKIYINNENPVVYTTKTVVLSNLTGENLFTFEKSGITFVPNNLRVSKVSEINVSAVVTCDISGYVKTDGGIVASNITLKIGSKTTKTDENGYYEFKQVSGILSIVDDGLVQKKQINSSGSYDFSISNFDYAYYLYKNGYNNLDNASSFRVVGSGKVSPSMGGDQEVVTVLKKDNLGNIIKQNLNYGETILGIDPKISLLAYFSANNNSWYHHTTKNVSNEKVATHISSELLNNSISEQGFEQTYGSLPSAYLPYNFSKDSGIKSITNISVNSSGNYAFTIELNVDKPVWVGYAKQMKTLSNQDVKEFSYIKLNYEIDKNGWIRNLNIDEKYIVQLLSVNISSNITYKFLTKSNNEKVSNIDVSTNAKINTSLKNDMSNYSSNNNFNNNHKISFYSEPIDNRQNVSLKIEEEYQYNPHGVDLKYKSSVDDKFDINFSYFNLEGKRVFSNELTVGQYIVKYEISSDKYIGNGEQKISIVPFKIEVKIERNEFVYNSENHEIKYTLNDYYAPIKIEYYLNNEIVNPVDVGIYDVKFSTTDTKNYILDYNATLSIKKRKIYLYAKTKSMVYGDTLPTFEYSSVNLLEKEPLNFDIVCDYNNKVGKHEIYFKQSKETTEVETKTLKNYEIVYNNAFLYVSKKDLLITPNENQYKVYGDDDPEILYSVSGLIDNDALSGKLSRQFGENIGNYYTINLGTINNENYNISISKVNFTIIKRMAFVSINNKTKEYGQYDPYFDINFENSNIIEDDKIFFNLALSREVGENVGEFKISIEKSKLLNYLIIANDAYLKINKKQIKVVANEIITTYKHDEKLTYNVFGLVGNDVLNGNLTRELGENVGEYEIFVGTLGNENYEINFTSAKYIINKAQLHVNLEESSKRFNEIDEYNYVVLGANENVELDFEREVGENVGEYLVLSCSIKNQNYEIVEFNSNVFKILPAELNIEITNNSKFYGEKDSDFEYIILGENYFDIDIKFSREVGENVGFYNFVVDFISDNNYQVVNIDELQFEIKKADLVIDLKDKNVIFNNNKVFVDDLNLGVDLIYEYTTFFGEKIEAPINAGEYYVQAKFDGNENYNPSISNVAKIVINKKFIPVVLTKSTFMYVDGKNVEHYPEFNIEIDSYSIKFERDDIVPIEIGNYPFSIISNDPNYEINFSGVLSIVPQFVYKSNKNEATISSNNVNLSNSNISIYRNNSSKLLSMFNIYRDARRCVAAYSFVSNNDAQEGEVFDISIRAPFNLETKIYVVDSNGEVNEANYTYNNGCYCLSINDLSSHILVTKSDSTMYYAIIIISIIVFILTYTITKIAFKIYRDKFYKHGKDIDNMKPKYVKKHSRIVLKRLRKNHFDKSDECLVLGKTKQK